MDDSPTTKKKIINVISWQYNIKSIDIDDMAEQIKNALIRQIDEELGKKGVGWPTNGLESERWVMLPSKEEIKERLRKYLNTINGLRLRRIAQESVSRIETLVKRVEETSGGVKFYTPGIDREPIKIKNELR